VDWSGYSFASGHTIGATLFYGQLVLFAFSVVKSRRWRSLIVVTAALFILMVGFSRIALGAHYLTDVLAAICFGMIWLAVCLLISNRFRRESVVSLPLDLVEEPVLVPVEAVTQLPLDPPA
jgi:undecaprenyl-diphosphatase